MVAHNSEKYIHSAISSIINQTYTNWELIIVNDGSTDNTESIIEMFKDKRIIIHKNENNKGISHSRNQALSLSNGEFIAILDSDDVANEVRLENQVSYLQKHSDVSVVATAAAHIDQESNIIYSPPLFEIPSGYIHAHLLFANCIYHSSVLMRKSLLPSNAYNINFPTAEDYDLWIKLSKNTKLSFIPELYTLYRVHMSSITQTNKTIISECSNMNVLNQTIALGLKLTDDELKLWVDFPNVDNVFTFNDLILLHRIIRNIQPESLSRLNVDVDMFKNLTQSVFKKRVMGLFIGKEYNPSLLIELFNPELKPFRFYSIIQIIKFILKCLFMYDPKSRGSYFISNDIFIMIFIHILYT